VKLLDTDICIHLRNVREFSRVSGLQIEAW
jgi:hypothetical protein